MLVYLYGYAITQFLLFFVRDNLIVNFLGLNWGLKQAQWTSLVVLIILLPITYLVLRYSKPVPEGEVAATYGIPQKPKMAELPEEQPGAEEAEPIGDEEPPKAEEEQPEVEEAEKVEDKEPETEEEQPEAEEETAKTEKTV